jgi:uncharacterized membrane protein
MKSAPMSTQTLIAAALTALLSATAAAQVHPEKPDYPYEKCYGIVKVGMNDCFTANNSCAGTVDQDNLPGAWIYVPKGTCKRITGSMLNAPK